MISQVLHRLIIMRLKFRLYARTLYNVDSGDVRAFFHFYLIVKNKHHEY